MINLFIFILNIFNFILSTLKNLLDISKSYLEFKKAMKEKGKQDQQQITKEIAPIAGLVNDWILNNPSADHQAIMEYFLKIQAVINDKRDFECLEICRERGGRIEMYLRFKKDGTIAKVTSYISDGKYRIYTSRQLHSWPEKRHSQKFKSSHREFFS